MTILLLITSSIFVDDDKMSQKTLRAKRIIRIRLNIFVRLISNPVKRLHGKFCSNRKYFSETKWYCDYSIQFNVVIFFKSAIAANWMYDMLRSPSMIISSVNYQGSNPRPVMNHLLSLLSQTLPLKNSSICFRYVLVSFMYYLHITYFFSFRKTLLWIRFRELGINSLLWI